MKLILLHGNFQDALLKKVSQIKKGYDPFSITETSGTDFTPASLGLFSEKRLVILENPDLNTVEKAVLEKDPDLTMVFKFNKALEKSSATLKKVTEFKGEIFIFDESAQTSIFPFLDMLGVKSKNSLKEFEKNYSEFGGQYILTMLAYFLRRMIQKPKSDFVRQKIASQKKNFDSKKIEFLYREIIETDFRIKQGRINEKLGVTLLVQKIID